MSSTMKKDCFFFQAEDGIRDFHVTGVQTCALPISASLFAAHTLPARAPARGSAALRGLRSEERRVGKECRTRRSPKHENKKNARPASVAPTMSKGTYRRYMASSCDR